MRGLSKPKTYLALMLWAVGIACVAYGLPNSVDGFWPALQLGLGGLAFGAVGLVLTIRTHLAMGWLFLGAQILMGLSIFRGSAAYALMILLSAILLVFPTGRLPSRRWLWAVPVLVVSAVSWVGIEVLGLIDDEELSEDLSWVIAFISTTLVLAASMLRLFNDYRQARGQTRQQLKPFVLVLTCGGFLLALSASGLSFLASANQWAGVVLLVGSPIAIGVSVTRYRLYEVDRIVSRTVTYAIVVLFLALVFAFGVVAVPNVVIGTGEAPPLIVAASTLAVAALFNPMRRRVQTAIDRRFNRSKYDHEQIAEEFANSLREGVDFDHVRRGWVDVVTKTMNPRSISLWTKVS